MRVAVLSDIHANLRALDAVLAAVGEVDALWHLGDVVGYGPDPDAVVDRLRARGALGVRGNHDAAALGGPEIAYFNVDARHAMEWTREAIAPATRAWLDDQPEIRTEGDFCLVHGSPRDPTWEYVTTAPAARLSLEALTTPYALNGHTHLPLVFRDVDGFIETITPANGSVLGLTGARLMANPGSVGQPRDGDPRAGAMVLDLDRGELRWYRVAYDIEGTQRAMRAAGLPGRLVDRLAHGL